MFTSYAQNLPTAVVDKRVQAGGTGTFALSIKKWVERTGLDIATVKRKIAFDVAAKLIMRTPVDTGRARGNWMIGFAAINSATSEVVDKSGKGRLTEIQSTLKKLDGVSDTAVYITNSLPYIARLEYGFSQQAPEGMVRLTAAEFAGIAAEAVNFVKSTSGSGRLE